MHREINFVLRTFVTVVMQQEMRENTHVLFSWVLRSFDSANFPELFQIKCERKMVEEGGKRCHGDASAYVFCAGASVRLIQLPKFSFIFCLKVHQAIAAKRESMPLRTGQIELE